MQKYEKKLKQSNVLNLFILLLQQITIKFNKKIPF